MGNSGIYSAEELLAWKTCSIEPLIEGLIWEKDNIFIIGTEKVGKSILALQFAFALTSGQPLFGEYKVKHTCPTLYVQTEGKLDETKERIEAMLKVNECDTRNLWIAYFPSLTIDTDGGLQAFISLVEARDIKPQIIILDPLYHSIKGNLV